MTRGYFKKIFGSEPLRAFLKMYCVIYNVYPDDIVQAWDVKYDQLARMLRSMNYVKSSDTSTTSDPDGE